MAQAVEAAAKNNPAVVGAQADLEAAREAIRSAKSRLRPSASLNGFATAGSYGAIYPSAPRVDPAYALLAPSGGLLDANVMLMIPLLTGGLLNAQVGSVQEIAAAAQYDLRETQAEASLKAVDAYLRALLAAETASAAQARVEAGSELVRTTRAQFEAGKGIEASVQRSESELAQSQRALTAALGERKKSLLMLKEAMGIDLDTAVALTDPLDREISRGELAGYLTKALSGRGSILAARARLRASEADVRALEGSQKPQVYGIAMADAANQAGSRGASIGLTISIPLFDGGQRRADVSRARSIRERERANVRQIELTVQREVRESYIDFDTANANVASAKSSVVAATSAYEVAALRYANGKAILVEPLDAMQALTQARRDLAQALYERQIAYVRLLRAAGLPLVEEVK
ncbi:TolC family protein [Fimbriimonas ginsengisoli]|uniref:Outer membrane efflux protein n=1 Tax=Fimbriimonas ginsengisoli Gsoil 348 TaxID=661478 RepID=A0A068NJJ9_FIMGI|nr:TolC family protein [Fimbriimonas ginsengisoli]AIE83793.1 outer membrane efflux protein [Fimbriimonas ginsengisoli Gsoil 348]